MNAHPLLVPGLSRARAKDPAPDPKHPKWSYMATCPLPPPSGFGSWMCWWRWPFPSSRPYCRVEGGLSVSLRGTPIGFSRSLWRLCWLFRAF
eukprot:4584555-Prymnesium_polylepis.2